MIDAQSCPKSPPGVGDPFASIPRTHFIHRTRRFPIRPDTKRPALAGWQNASTTDPAQIAHWAAQFLGCAWAIAYAESGLILVETDPKALKDVKKKDGERVGDERADAELAKLFASWGLPAGLTPHFRSRSGGKHFVFRVPAAINLKESFTPGTSAPPYRYTQGGLAKAEGFAQDCVECKINGFGLIPPSSFEGRAYTLWPSGATEPYPAPVGLIEKVDRRSARFAINAFVVPDSGEIKVGRFDLRQLIKKILRVNYNVGMDYATWRNLLWALLAEYGPYVAGQIGDRIHDGNSKTSNLLNSILGNGAKGHRPGDARLESFFKYAAACGDKESIRPPTSTMFGGTPVVPDIDAILAEIDAEAASPQIASPPPAPTGAIPMLGRGDAQAKAWAPVLARIPVLPRNDTCPEMPATGHPLRDAINAAIPGIIATGDIEALAVITAAHADTASKIAPLISGLDHQAVSNRASGLIEEAEHLLRPADFVRETRTGEIQNDNIDNVAFFLSQLDAEIRWNGWTEAMEVRGWKWDDWTFVSDHVVTLLRARASQTGTRFRVGKDFLWDSLLALALRNNVDPVLETLNQLEDAWDGVPRLDAWLHRACGVPNDAYHAAVSRNVVGGMVKRARNPGVKHDEVLLFIGEQGTNKSGVPEILAIQKRWFTDEIELGDPSKELVLSLAGKLVVEIGEMGRKSVAGNNAVKSMLARCVDRGRTAYARTVTARPRRNIFVATTNDPEPLSDLTGNRRWLPVRIGAEIDVEWLRANVGRIVGEAAVREARGETFRIPRELWRTAAEHQKAATETPDYQDVLREWLAPTGLAVFMTIADISHIAREAAGGRAVKSSEYNRVIEDLGFQRRTKRVDGKPVEVWLRGDGKDAYRVTAKSLRTLPRGVNLSMEMSYAATEPGCAPMPPLPTLAPPPPY